MLDNKKQKEMNISGKNGRRGKSVFSIVSYYKFLSFLKFHTLILSTSTTLLFLPALFSCVSEPPMVTMSMAGQFQASGPLDIFIFSNSGARHLDSYHHMENYSVSDIHLRSQNGEKQIFVCSNGQRTRYDWSGVNSMEALEDVCIDLKNERRDALCSTGQATVSAGSDEVTSLYMKRMASEIVLQSVRCDFSGTAYEGKVISEPQIYLTNVNSRCSIASDGQTVPLGIVNAGRVDFDEISEFIEPDIIYHKMEKDIGTSASAEGISFLCYPNNSPEEGPGTPFTRLVIEGKIDGETFWWPIDINRNERTEAPGIHRNCRYILDVNITRKGTDDPDKAIESDVAEVIMNIQPWKEKENHIIIF